MLLYFDKNGQLLEYLEYDDSARVGTTNFKIFAYFEDLDSYSKYGCATIRFKKPDLEAKEYPDLFMVKHTLNFDPTIEESDYFTTEHGTYHGFIFDFDSAVVNDNEPVKLLDTPGIWEASITLQNTSRSNVTGLIKFTVESAVSDTDDFETELDVSDIVNNIRVLLINDYVPYEGSNKDLNLGTHALKFGEDASIIKENGRLKIESEDEINEIATEKNVPDFQNNLAIIINPTTNINGWVLSNYESESFVFQSTYSAYKITRSGNNLTEEQAKTYMKAMCGSSFLPKYDFNKPQYTFFITADGELLKPQYDDTNGLLLFKVTNPFVKIDDLQEEVATQLNQLSVVTESQMNAAIDEALGSVEDALEVLDAGEGI